MNPLYPPLLAALPAIATITYAGDDADLVAALLALPGEPTIHVASP